MNYTTLLLAEEVSEKTIDLVSLISICAVAALLLILSCVCLWGKNFNTKKIVYAALSVALSFALSFIKIAPVTYGGSITLASMVPLMIYAYCYGPISGLVTGLVYGVLQFVQDPYILVPITFVLDYLLAFCGFFFMGLMGKLMHRESGKELAPVLIGCGLTYAWRFVMHLFSGFVYFDMGAIWVNLPTTSALTYSFLYQAVYLIPDFIISFFALWLLCKKQTFSRLSDLIKS
ncbi:MAG: energy-coupled thiamine transporter ThiT [Clostridia bacterium]|jgi:thiamine transporter|nr:energy-coupled thiamine transporter ThiT [Clostridia bacterium]MBQ1942499.1 energy-coupled thiamine transporter ThiT [Clostridia bacterium]MBQ5801440.1 energy-coupled thiamine transporter ThiT [Clostridia bacterium]